MEDVEKKEQAEPKIETVKDAIAIEPSVESNVLQEATKESDAFVQEEQAKTAVATVEHFQILNEIKTLIENRLSYDSAKEKSIDKLSDEVKFFRDNFIFQSQKPIFIELIMFYDSLERIINSIEQDLSKEQVLSLSSNLVNLKEELLQILFRRDITPFEEHPEFLDYKLHKTAKTVPTNAECENNKVDKIMRVGFRCNGKILRPEEVVIRKFVKD